MPDQVMIYGRHPAAAALDNSARKIKAIYVTDDAQTWIQADHGAALTRRNLTPIVVDRADMADALPPQDKHVHQGVVIVALPLSPPSLDEWLDNRQDDNQNDGQSAKQTVLVMLDQITDGRNIGAIMRSALAFGAHGIIATDRNTPTETSAMLRAASGAAEHMPLIRVVNLSRAITSLQDHHFTVAGLDARGTADLTGCADEDRLVLVLGAEGSGLRHLTREKVDQLIRIPMSDHAESLNVSNAAAVALYAATAGQFKNIKND
jgi:23S rRNA (guanosine2251-2'-O)-methyltransferase